MSTSQNHPAGLNPQAGKPLLDALCGRPVARPPFWLMRQAGRYLPEYRELRAKAPDFLALCLTPALAVEATLQPIRRYGMDAAILFSDILVLPHALGQRVWFEEEVGPRLEPIASGAALRRLRDSGDPAALDPVYEAVARLAEALPPAVALIGFAGAPWTVASYMVEGGSSRDFLATKSFAYREPEAFARLIELLCAATAEHLCRQIAAGAAVVQLFDSWAGVLSEPDFRQFVTEPTRKIVARVKAAHPQAPVIGFPRGAGASYVGYAEATGVDAVSLDTTVPLDWAARVLQPRVAVQGNLDPAVLLAGGALLARETRRIADALGVGRFVFNLGHGVHKDTPPEHVAQLAALLRDRTAQPAAAVAR